jgi:DNA-binding MarR family transcriptional regulator
VQVNDERSEQALAAEVWRRIFGFFMSTRPQRDVVLERLGLTPNDAKAISSLDDGPGRSMRSLAEEWLCDASNATWMVDRLERRGLAERRGTSADKRVKLVVLTPMGVETRESLIRGMNEPPRELLELQQPALEALVAALRKLPAGAGPAQRVSRKADAERSTCP